jgi:hypothetical protein
MENASAGLLGEGFFQSDVISRMALILFFQLVLWKRSWRDFGNTTILSIGKMKME